MYGTFQADGDIADVTKGIAVHRFFNGRYGILARPHALHKILHMVVALIEVNLIVFDNIPRQSLF